MSSQRSDSEEFMTHKNLGFHHLKERSGFVFHHQRLATLGLVLLNAVLLMAAIVTGIYCAQVDPQDAHSGVIMNHFSNNTDLVKAKTDALTKLAKERANGMKMKLEVKHTTSLMDNLQKQLEVLQTEKANLLANKSTIEESCNRCEKGWTFLHSSCYYFSNQVPDSKKNWPDSRADCVARGAEILVINNLKEQQFISSNIPKPRSSATWWENGFWIGLTDQESPGTWTWTNNKTEVETRFWRPGQPSHDGVQSGHCAAFYFLSQDERTWYNGKCQQHLHYWICEKEPRES